MLEYEPAGDDMKKYDQLTSNNNVPQTQPISPNQVQNSAGGYVYKVSTFNQLLRFLLLGSDQPTYYATARDLTKINIKVLEDAIREDYTKTVDLITDVSVNGRAPSNDTALFALAVVASVGELEARRYALSKLNDVARTGTHLFTFVHYINGMRGWGVMLKNAICNWYLSKSAEDLALQVIKYAQRDGWSHKDVLRLSHPKTENLDVSSVLKYIAKGEVDDRTPKFILGTQLIKTASSTSDILRVLDEYKLPREVIPTEYLNDTKVWEMLLSNNMPYTAMMRNLGKMSSLGMTRSNTSDATQIILSTLTDQQKIKRSRVHPISILTALYVYSMGRGIKGSLTWDVNRKIVDALNAAFYKSFGNVTPTGRKILLALDISGSMSFDSINGIQGLTPRVVSAAMALVTMNVEKKCDVVGFSHNLIPLAITPSMTLDAVCKYVDRLPFGGTDCSLPMEYALKHGIDYDAFFVYTDSETYVGRRHPSVALKEVRKKFNNDAKLAVVGLVANNFSIADPSDPGMLDFVGFDAALPQVLSEFISM